MWELLEKRGSLENDPWTVDIGQLTAIKLSDLIEVTLPAQTRGGQRRQVHQRDLVQWDEPQAGQTMPPMTERHGVLPFRYLRQNQRAMLLRLLGAAPRSMLAYLRETRDCQACGHVGSERHRKRQADWQAEKG